MAESLNVCLSCGLCCDGTVIGFVQLNRSEFLALKDIMELEEGNGEGLFLMPCANLGKAGCTIYSKRPKQCAKFECGLLKAIDQKELQIESAIEIIKLVKTKKEAINKGITALNIELKSNSFYFKMLELKKLFLSPDFTLTSKHQTLMFDIKHLDQLLASKFGVSLYPTKNKPE